MTDQAAEMRAFIIERVTETAETLAMTDLQIDGAFNIFDSGVVDSLGFIDLVADVEERFNVVLDFGDRDPSEFGTVDGMIESVTTVQY
jgi:acyl carrier protein